MLPALALSLMLTAGPAQGERELKEAIAHLRAFREEKALESLKHARRLASGSPELLARVHLVTGLVHAQLARERDAVEAFSSAIMLDRDIRPSEEDTSPKVLEWFNRARKQQGLPALGEKKAELVVKDPPPPKPEQPPQIVYVPAPVEPPPPKSQTPLYVGIGIAAAGAVVAATGAVFGMRAKAAEQSARDESDLVRATELHGGAVKDAGTANVLFAAAGVLGVGGGVVIGVSF